MLDMALNVKSPFVTVGVLQFTFVLILSIVLRERRFRISPPATRTTGSAERSYWQTIENLHSDDTLFEFLGVASESLFNDKPEKPGVTFAVFEAGARSDTFLLYSHPCVHIFLCQEQPDWHIRHRTTRFLKPGSIRPIAYDRKS